MKQCIKCFEYKEIFYTANVCIDCYSERKRIYNQKNKDRDRERRKKDRENNPEKYIDRNNKQNERQKEARRVLKEKDKLENPENYIEKTEEEKLLEIGRKKEEAITYAKQYRKKISRKS